MCVAFLHVRVQALDNAEQLVSGSISFAAAARNSLLDLDAWRLSTCGAGTESATPTSAYTQPEHCLDGCQAGASDMDSTCDRLGTLPLVWHDFDHVHAVTGAQP
jgi:hypothetical protein